MFYLEDHRIIVAQAETVRISSSIVVLYLLRLEMFESPEFRKKVSYYRFASVDTQRDISELAQEAPLSESERLALYRHQSLLRLAGDIAVAARTKGVKANRHFLMSNPFSNKIKYPTLTLLRGWILASNVVSGEVRSNKPAVTDIVLATGGNLLATTYPGESPLREIRTEDACTRFYMSGNFLLNVALNIDGWKSSPDVNDSLHAANAVNDNLENSLAMFVAINEI